MVIFNTMMEGISNLSEEKHVSGDYTHILEFSNIFVLMSEIYIILFLSMSWL